MDSARWDRVQALFHEAAALPDDAQRAFLDGACGGDATLLADVLALLDEDRGAASLLDRDVGELASRLLDDPANLPPGLEQLGPYRLRTLLGEGGMGAVYLAERTDLGSLVAIKVLRDAWLSPARRDRFAGEQRLLAQLTHPGIARLYDVGTLRDGTPCIVMEYVEGVPLTDYCNAHSASIDERLRLLRAVGEAVQYAHRHAVIHRDLKPSNILVTPDGSIRLLDFGIAKQIEGDDAAPLRTRTEFRMMTPAYAAPEQIRGEQVGIHTDVYSLGVILYELLAGQLPHDLSNRTPGQVEQTILALEPDRPSAVVHRRMRDGRAADLAAGVAGVASMAGVARVTKAAWADLDVLCLTAMHKEQARRYASVEALIRDIDHYLAKEPLEARPDAATYRLGKFLKRNRNAVTAGAIVSVGILALIVTFTARLAVARNDALAEAARTQRIQKFMLNLFQGGDEETGPGEDLKVVTLVERGVQEARSLAAEPDIQAELYQTLGGIYQKLGNFDRADELLHSALEERRALRGPEHREVADSLIAVGMLRNDQAKIEEAEALVREGLAMSRRTLPAGHPAIAKAMAALGVVLDAKGQYPEAIAILDEAVRLQSSKDAAPADLASTMTELANVHFYAGHYDISESLNQRVLAMDRQIYGARHPHVADDLINIGALKSEAGRWDEAEKYYRQGVEIIQAWYGHDHRETASALVMLGRALVQQDRTHEAMGYLNDALAILERVYGPSHPRVASNLNELATIALKEGDFETAVARYTRALEIYRSVHGENHYLVGVLTSNLATVELRRKNYPKAEALARSAVATMVKTLPADHVNIAIARIKLGRALALQKRFGEAEAPLLAAYAVLTKMPNPPANWLNPAREELEGVYQGLGEPDKARRFHDELAKGTRGAP